MSLLVVLGFIVFCVVVHLTTIAVVARGLGVTVRVVSYGFGPALWSSGIVRIGALPTGGYVRMKDSREEPVPDDERHSAFDGRSVFEQVVISMSGCAALALLAWTVLGTDTLGAIGTSVVRILSGALSPMDEAQRLIGLGVDLVRSAPALTVLGWTAAVQAAVNLLPLPTLNGGIALMALGRRLGVDRWWPEGLTKALFFAWIAVALSWCVAAVLYVVTP